MRGEELEPLIRVKASQKRMRHPVFTEVAAPGFFDERQRPLPRSTQFRQYLLFFVDHLGFERDRCFAPDDARFHEHHRNMKPFEKRHGFRGFLHQLSGPAQDDPLDRTQVADQFASRPSPFGWPRFPLVRRHGIRGAQKFALRPSQVFDDLRK